MRGLRYHRYTHEMSQQALADYLHITQAHYSKIERGEINPKLVHLVKLAQLFEVSIDALL